MLNFIIANFATIIVGAIVFIAVAAVLIKMICDAKNHKNTCGCGCANCPSSGMCHNK